MCMCLFVICLLSLDLQVALRLSVEVVIVSEVGNVPMNGAWECVSLCINEDRQEPVPPMKAVSLIHHTPAN